MKHINRPEPDSLDYMCNKARDIRGAVLFQLENGEKFLLSWISSDSFSVIQRAEAQRGSNGVLKAKSDSDKSDAQKRR